jgi:hypothetical protein
VPATRGLHVGVGVYEDRTVTKCVAISGDKLDSSCQRGARHARDMLMKRRQTFNTLESACLSLLNCVDVDDGELGIDRVYGGHA